MERLPISGVFAVHDTVNQIDDILTVSLGDVDQLIIQWIGNDGYIPYFCSMTM